MKSEPAWWYGDGPHWQPALLRPVSTVYGAIARWRYRRAAPYRSKFPVICVGNFTAGGTGKTPMSLLIADIAETCGCQPWFLSRGYGGRLDGQERVDPARHTAAEVGGEPLLLAARAATVISRDRRLGAEFIERFAPPDALIIMDDGLQNPALAKDLTIAVVDAGRGFGNGAVIPAGPLRAPLAFQIAQTDLIVLNGATGDLARRQLAGVPSANAIPHLSAEPQPSGETAWLRGLKVIAFAAIANPERFFKLLESLGANIVERIAFNDHQSMSEADAQTLLAPAAKHNAQLVTTEKDFVRLSGLDGARANVRAKSKTLPIALRMPDADRAVLVAHVTKALAERR